MAEYDREIVNLAQEILGIRKPKVSPPLELEVLASAIAVERHPDRTDRPKHKEIKEIKTAAELAQMIEAGLARHPHCPRRGFQVTVYGTTQWRAMLVIKPAAGPVRNPQEWRDLTEQLADRLRDRYDLAWR